MTFRYGVLCLLAAFIVFILFLKNYETWTRPVEFIPEKEATKKSMTKVEGSAPVAGQDEPATIASYVLIAEKNLFNPERKDFPIVKPSVVEPAKAVKKPPVRPKIILYGVTLSGDYRAASLVNQGRPLQKGERETLTVKLGERIGEYKLANITSDRIRLEAEEDSFEVLLYDSTTPKKRMGIRTEIKPATIISTQPAQGPTPVPGIPGIPASVPQPTPAIPARPIPPKETIVPTPSGPMPTTSVPAPGPVPAPAPTPSRPGRIRSNYYPTTPTQ